MVANGAKKGGSTVMNAANSTIDTISGGGSGGSGGSGGGSGGSGGDKKLVKKEENENDHLSYKETIDKFHKILANAKASRK